ncbi:hypothetical protein [Streptomyces spiramenti]|uniref:Uncharacterized protein n=1 Tax=Streptomyces spiramenti TaxID=2720606 RepID=A0ABX1ADB2_9ACTN|nr:hypothetical protein [Streptomyces spiramenti]NJP65168.1 hypothetical protein [Streptomyces spiramenti]
MDDDVAVLALEAGSVRMQMTAGGLTADAGDAVALRSVRRACATARRTPALHEQFGEYLALELRLAARCSGPDPARRPVGTVVRHAAELIEAGRNLHTVLHALAPLVELAPRDDTA